MITTTDKLSIDLVDNVAHLNVTRHLLGLKDILDSRSELPPTLRHLGLDGRQLPVGKQKAVLSDTPWLAG
jgi:hypothetical protein